MCLSAACKTLSFCESLSLYSLRNANGHESDEGHEDGNEDVSASRTQGENHEEGLCAFLVGFPSVCAG